MRNRLSPVRSAPDSTALQRSNYDHKSIQLRRGTTSEWNEFGSKCMPLAGEMCVELHQEASGAVNGHVSIKVGNGIDVWNDLPYLLTDSDHPAFDLTQGDIEAIKNSAAGLVISPLPPTYGLKEGLMWLNSDNGDLNVYSFDSGDNPVWFEFPATGVSANGALIPYGNSKTTGYVYTDQVFLRLPFKEALTQQDANLYLLERVEILEQEGCLPDEIDGGTYMRRFS
ncbi:MAG: hypothetical protein VXA88_09580 [Rhodospirillales bacterium]